MNSELPDTDQVAKRTTLLRHELIDVEDALQVADDARWTGGLGEIAKRVDKMVHRYDPCDRLEEKPLDRRDVCAFLGIRESTLSNWFKEESVPQPAQVAFFLLDSLLVLAEEVRLLRKEVARPKVMASSENMPSSEDGRSCLKVSRFIPGTSPGSVDMEEILATGIRNPEVAQWIVAQEEVIDLLNEISGLEINYCEDNLWKVETGDLPGSFSKVVEHGEAIVQINRKYRPPLESERTPVRVKPAKAAKTPARKSSAPKRKETRT